MNLAHAIAVAGGGLEAAKIALARPARRGLVAFEDLPRHLFLARALAPLLFRLFLFLVVFGHLLGGRRLAKARQRLARAALHHRDALPAPQRVESQTRLDVGVVLQRGHQTGQLGR